MCRGGECFGVLGSAFRFEGADLVDCFAQAGAAVSLHAHGALQEPFSGHVGCSAGCFAAAEVFAPLPLPFGGDAGEEAAFGERADCFCEVCVVDPDAVSVVDVADGGAVDDEVSVWVGDGVVAVHGVSLGCRCLFGVVGVVVGAGVELGFFAELFKCVLEDQGVE